MPGEPWLESYKNWADAFWKERGFDKSPFDDWNGDPAKISFGWGNGRLEGDKNKGNPNG